MIEIRILDAPPPDPHDHNHPDNWENLQRVVNLLLLTSPCPACGNLFSVVAGPGAAWVIDHMHQPGCPEGEDPEPYEVNVQGGYDAEAHRTAEAIWARSNEEP